MADPVLSLQIDTPSAAGPLGYLVLDDPTYGLLDTAELAPDQIYVDKISQARNINIKRGMSSFTPPLFRPDAGSLTAVLDNRTRSFDPTESTDIVPGRAVKMQATYAATTYDLFTGIIHDWPLDYPQGAHGDATTTISANDGIGKLATTNVAEARPQELTGRRVGALLNLVGWPANMRSVDVGLTTMPASVQSVSAWSALLEAQDSEMGELYVGPDGTARFRSRDSIVSATRSRVSQATFGDGVGEQFFATPSVSFTDQQILNAINVVFNAAGDAYLISDATSMSLYDVHDDELQIRTADPVTAVNIGTFLVNLFSQPQARVQSITVKPFRDPTNLFPQVLGRQLGDRISVKFQPPGGGARIVHDCFIRGIQHSFSALANARDWTTTFVLQDALAWPSPFILDTSVLDGTDDLLWF